MTRGQRIKQRRVERMASDVSARDPQAFRAICDHLPAHLWDTCDSRQLALIVRSVWRGVRAGYLSAAQAA